MSKAKKLIFVCVGVGILPKEPEMTADKQQIPFPFVLDELFSLRPTVKRVFGFTYLYLGERLLCALRDSKQKSGSNGIWLFTTTEHLESLGREFPELSRRYHWRSGKKAWVILPSKLGEFEEYAFKACELILNGDRRIGRISRGRISDFRSPISD